MINGFSRIHKIRNKIIKEKLNMYNITRERERERG